MHRAAFPLTQARAAAEKLRHDRFRIRATSQAVTVVPVGGEDIVIGPQRINRADGYGLLTNIEMTEAADLPESVHLRSPLLEAADQQHLSVEF
jgi:hypothetical protein